MIYIILPIHNRKKITESFIKNLVEQTYKDFELILVDDGSLDGTSEMVLSYIPETTIIRGKGNWWWGGSLHQAYKWVKRNNLDINDDVLIINDDVKISNNFLELGVEFLKNNETSLCLAKAVDIQDPKRNTCGIHINWSKMTFEESKNNKDINCFSTRGLFLKVKSFLDIGDFHPILLPHYFSDYEYTVRAFKKGYKLLVDSNIFLFFNEDKNVYKKGKENFFIFLKKHFSKKNPGNPIYFLSFIFLSVPAKFKLGAVLKVLYMNMKVIIKNIF
ncbi:MAG: glycosyltransferase [Patescibacteria group bacterium]|nr:glycosyltransferase [Patescibacteria group bacterium]